MRCAWAIIYSNGSSKVSRGALFVVFALSVALVGSLRGSVEITAIEMTVSDLHRAIGFYSDVLQFRVVSENRASDHATAHLQLGEESLILREYIEKGRPIPNDLKPNDQSFQHIAIVVGDMDAACEELVRQGGFKRSTRFFFEHWRFKE